MSEGSYLKVQEGDEVTTIPLRGDRLGYNVDLATGMVRVWDKGSTYLVGERFLVTLCLENVKISR